MRKFDPTLFKSGPIANLLDRLKQENEVDFIALMDVSKKDSMEAMLLRLFVVVEKMFEQERAAQEERIRSLKLDLEEREAKLEKARKEIAYKNAQLAFAREHIVQIIEDFQSLIKDPDKLLSALKIVCDILENGIGKLKKPTKYHYNIEVTKIAILTVVHARCSFRSAVAVLDIFKKYLPHVFEDGIPSYTTVRYWDIKSGLALMPLLKKEDIR